jgi:hypothetical protein
MTFRWGSFSLLLAALLSRGACGHAQERCPWLNVATASGFLEGAASLTVEKPTLAETDCIFRYQGAGSVEILQIDVKLRQGVSKGIAPEQSTCTAPGTPVRAIGNEALLCADDNKSERSEEVIGRVRDSVFIVRVSTSSKNDAAMPRAILEQRAKDTAEQVAGALF